MLVIGTGFHRQLFGNEPTSLTDWGCLLRETAKQHTLNDIPEPSSNPTMVWEAMVMALSSNAPKPIAAHEAEVTLRKSVSETLKNCQLPKKANQQQSSFIDRFPNLDAYVLKLIGRTTGTPPNYLIFRAFKSRIDQIFFREDVGKPGTTFDLSGTHMVPSKISKHCV